MLFLLRKIRRKLISTDNKVITYLLYAMGEVILVVVGILIAVQIDGWIDQRKQRENESNYLFNLRKDLAEDTTELSSIIDRHYYRSQICFEFLNLAKSGRIESQEIEVFNDNLISILIWDQFHPNQNTFLELQNSGNLNILRSDSLKTKLLILNQELDEVEMGIKHISDIRKDLLFEPVVTSVSWWQNFDLEEMEQRGLIVSKVMNPAKMSIQRQQLFENEAFLNGLFLYANDNKALGEMHDHLKSQMIELITIINNQLSKE